MKLTLIFVPPRINNNFEATRFRDQNIGYIPPLNLVLVASLFRKEHCEVQVIDVDAERLNLNEVVDKIEEFGSTMIGFSLSTYNFDSMIAWIREIRKKVSLPILAGGPQLAIYPAETMSHQEIDYGIIGEAENVIPKFVQFCNDQCDSSDVPSLAYRESGQVVINERCEPVENLDDIPFPSRDLLNNQLYSNVLTRKKNFTALLSSRGCPYRCTFCDQKETKYRYRSAGNVFNEIKINFEKYGVREFDVYDSTFTANKKRVKELCKMLIKHKMPINWTIRSRVDSVDNEMLKLLKQAGCHTIFYGIESSDPEILKMMKKSISVSRIKETIDETKKLGISTLGYFLFGYPGETRATAEATLEFSLELNLDYAQYSVLVPMPRTEIYEFYLKHTGIDYWAEFTKNPDTPITIPLINSELTKEELDEYALRAYKKFYLRPRIIINKLKNLQNFDNISRLVRGSIELLFTRS